MKNQMQCKYKINLHLTEKCNYKCNYCFGKFGTSKQLDIEHWKKIIDNLVASQLVHGVNLAGGEPLLYKNIIELMDYCNNKGLSVSLITNASLLNHNSINKDGRIYERIETLGISMDSFSSKTLFFIGRCDSSNKTLSFNDIQLAFTQAKQVNPSIKLKLNTVVSKLNYKEKMVGYIKDLGVQRWKILRVQQFKTDRFDNSSLLISDEEYNFFIENNQTDFNGKIVVEDDLENSYLIINPNGYLLDNCNQNYKPVGNLLKTSFAECLHKSSLDKEKYDIRYS